MKGSCFGIILWFGHLYHHWFVYRTGAIDMQDILTLEAVQMWFTWLAPEINEWSYHELTCILWGLDEWKLTVEHFKVLRGQYRVDIVMFSPVRESSTRGHSPLTRRWSLNIEVCRNLVLWGMVSLWNSDGLYWWGHWRYLQRREIMGELSMVDKRRWGLDRSTMMV